MSETPPDEQDAPQDAPKREGDPEARTGASRAISIVVIAVVLLAAAGASWLIFSTEPTAEREGASKTTAMLVDVVEVERGDYEPRIVATGTVEASRDVVLRPEVAGRITSISPAFAPGGFVEEGQELVRIEAADFRNVKAQRESDLRQALSDLALEQGRQEAAREEYAFLGEELPPENEALVLRKPQIEAARERVAAARAAVEQAELDLGRTTVEAPFDAHVIRRDANVGSQVSPSESLGRLVGVDVYWVAVELPLSKLRWVQIPREGEGLEAGSEVRIRNAQSWPKDAWRTGHVIRLVGALDADTRMARVLAAIPDPLARAEGAEGAQRLIVGEYVEVTIEGEEVEDVVRVDRDYVRDDDTVWVMEDGKLAVKEVEIVLRDAEHAYVSTGLDDGDRVVTTNLSTVAEGSPLRLEGEREGEPDA